MNKCQLPVDVLNDAFRFMRTLAKATLSSRRPFYRINCQGWKLLLLPPLSSGGKPKHTRHQTQ